MPKSNKQNKQIDVGRMLTKHSQTDPEDRMPLLQIQNFFDRAHESAASYAIAAISIAATMAYSGVAQHTLALWLMVASVFVAWVGVVSRVDAKALDTLDEAQRLLRRRIVPEVAMTLTFGACLIVVPSDASKVTDLLLCLIFATIAIGNGLFKGTLPKLGSFLAVLSLTPLHIHFVLRYVNSGDAFFLGVLAMLAAGFVVMERRLRWASDARIAHLEANERLRVELCDHAETTRKLRESNAHFEALSTLSSDWFWKQDAQFRFTESTGAFSNNAALVKKVLGKARWELPTPLTPEQWDSHRDTVECHLPFRGFEYPVLGDGGEVRWLSDSGIPQFDANGGFVGYLGTGRDITSRKRTEEELRIAAIAFESQEAMAICDASFNILRVNQAFVDVTGYGADEVHGHKPSLLGADRHDAEFYSSLADYIRSHGAWRGEVWNRRKNGEEYPVWGHISAVRDHVGKTTHYVATFVDIASRKAAENEINSLAFYDPLTGLPNRRLLLDRLRHAMSVGVRSSQGGALLFIDLDNFKALNDTLGHHVGDSLLQQVGQRLLACVTEGDTVARLGGDEFVVVLEDLSPIPEEAASAAEVQCEAILRALNEVYDINGHKHHSTPSIGVALFADPHNSAEELMKRADLAMYQAKASGRNAVRFFDPRMQVEVSRRAILEASLREAVEGEQFLLHYQPQVDAQGRVTGAEALLRWQHPDHGLRLPIEFIGLAESTGLILPIGRWVLQTACAQLALWAQQSHLAHLCLAVNVSARQLHHPSFVQQVLVALATTGANPERLKLELTESLLVNDLEGAIAKMAILKRQGVGISLDDFGTGYSSLSILKRLPLDQLKIDKSFVKNITADANDAAIAKLVISLAQSLGLVVVAEGVEMQAQHDLLVKQGCHVFQGNWFCCPLPLQAFQQRVGDIGH